MDLSDKAMQLKPAGMSPEEWATRLELAACYRAFDWLGWTELIYNHITARVPGPERHYLINPYGLWYNEVTASNLVKIDVDGKVVDGSTYPVNVAGFVIHSAIHMARPDLVCVMHTHTRANNGVGMQKEGLLPISQKALLMYDFVRYHDFEGAAFNLGERERILADMGEEGRAMILIQLDRLLLERGEVARSLIVWD